MEECVTSLYTLTVSGKTRDVTARLGSLTLEVTKTDTEREDMSFWEELEILNEENFSSPEELERIERAEKELLIKFRKNRADEMENNDEKQKPDMIKNSTLDGKENSSHEEDDQPERMSPTDNFSNKSTGR
jgi:hypothetical protein